MLREERATPCQRRHNNIIGQCLLAEIEPSVSIEFSTIEFSTMCAFTAHVSYMGGTDYRRKTRNKDVNTPGFPTCKFTLFPCYLVTHKWNFPCTTAKCLQKLTKTPYKLRVLCMKNRIFATVFEDRVSPLSFTEKALAQALASIKDSTISQLASCKKQQTHTATHL